MIRLLLLVPTVLFVAYGNATATASTLLPAFPYGPYSLSANALFDEDTLAPDTSPSLFSQSATGYALGALDYTLTSRTARVATWFGAKSLDNGPASALVVASAGIVAIPDEGEMSGQPVTLYAHLVANSYGGAAAYQNGTPSSQLLVEAKIRPSASLPWQSFSGPGVIPIPAVIGQRVEIMLSTRASAGQTLDGAFDSYAAMDLQLFISYDALPPVSLLPRPIVPGDGTMDGSVDAGDYTLWADHYLETSASGALGGDFSNNGFVDAGDYTIWADHYLSGSASLAASAVPEPSTLLLAAMSALCLVGKICRGKANKG